MGSDAARLSNPPFTFKLAMIYYLRRAQPPRLKSSRGDVFIKHQAHINRFS